MQDNDTYTVAADELRQFVERIEQLESEKKDITEQIKEVYAEAKGRGYDGPALRQIVSLRRKDKDQVAEEAAETMMGGLVGCMRCALARRDRSSWNRRADLCASGQQVRALEVETLIEELLDAQQDINLAANERMDQSLCDASALIDRTESILRRILAALTPAPQPEVDAGEVAARIKLGPSRFAEADLDELPPEYPEEQE